MDHYKGSSRRVKQVDDNRANGNICGYTQALPTTSTSIPITTGGPYLATSTPHMPRRNLELPNFDVSVIPDMSNEYDNAFGSHMNVTVVENPRLCDEPKFSSRGEIPTSLYTSDDDSTPGGSSDSIRNGTHADANNNHKKKTVGWIDVNDTVKGKQDRQPGSVESEVDFLFHTALEFVQEPNSTSKPVASGSVPATKTTNISRQPRVTPSHSKSPPLLGATALPPSQYFRQEQSRKQKPSPVDTNDNIEDVLQRVQSLGIREDSNSDTSFTSGSDSDSDYHPPVRSPTVRKPNVTLKEVPATRNKVDREDRAFQAQPLPKELTGSVDNAVIALQRIISLIPSHDAFDSEIPKSLRVELFPHQIYGLMWLWWREQHVPFGGILADEMGLGKTVMILALICRGLSEEITSRKKKEERQASDRRLVPSRGTLVVCPASVMGQWEDEVTKKSRRISTLVYHGPNRSKFASAVAHSDIIITTYDTLRSEITSDLKYSDSPLCQVYWNRLVLDEGHIIRNPKTGLSQAACRLSAKHRWVVTGTPVHNKPGDMFSLIKFLRLQPFDDLRTWESWIGTKLVRSADTDRLNTIAKALMLRRTKEEVAAETYQGRPSSSLRTIPPKAVYDVYVDLKPVEKKLYDHLFTFAKQQLKEYLKSQEQRTNEMQQAAHGIFTRRDRKAAGEAQTFLSILALLVRLRQCAVLPYLMSNVIDKSEDMLEEPGDFDITKHLMSFKNPAFSPDFQSSKLEKMFDDIDNLKRACKARKEPMDKVVIVSQWVTLLDIVEKQLCQKGYTTTTISGKVKIQERSSVMQAFNENPKRPQIMLLSLAAGGVGLNLVGANHLYILDLHWNPQLELQAQDRIHRFGQTKPVTIHRYISRATVEEKIVELQKAKLELANSVLGSAQNKEGGALSVGQIRNIFGV